MWHSIEKIARDYNLDETALFLFVLKNDKKYNIADCYSGLEVNTANVDALVEDFRKEENNG